MRLPKEFEEYTRSLMGEALYSTLISALAASPPVSIRLNPFKVAKDAYLEDEEQLNGLQLTPVPWAKDGYLLSE